MTNITAPQLKQRLAELLEVPKKEVDDILWALNEVAVEAVKNGNSITFPGIGKLNCKIQAARTAHNPRTMEKVRVPAKVAVKFSVAKTLKDEAPSLQSKKGKALLEEVEESNKQKAKRKRMREKDSAVSKSKKSKTSSKTSGSKTSKRTKARF